MDYSFLRAIPGAICKPEPRTRTKGRADRAERLTKGQVRAICVDRDGYCRVAEMAHRTICTGRQQWTHLEDKRRCFTRGMKPDARHGTGWTCMMCKKHHCEYDAHVFDVHFVDEDKGADSALEVIYR